MAQLVKNLPAFQTSFQKTWVGKIPWRRERLPTPVFWPEEFHRLYSSPGHKESNTTERLSLSCFILRWSFSLPFKWYCETYGKENKLLWHSPYLQLLLSIAFVWILLPFVTPCFHILLLFPSTTPFSPRLLLLGWKEGAKDEGENEDGRESYSLIGEDLGRNEFSIQVTD